MKIIDLTLPLYTGMPVYPGDPEASIELIQTIDKHGWNMRRLEINTHDGTHVNSPIHGIANGKSLDDFPLESFCGSAIIFTSEKPLAKDMGIIFRDRNIDQATAKKILQVHPRFVGLSSQFEVDVEIEKELLKADIMLFERLCNLDRLPQAFEFYGMPLKIKQGDGSPVRAFAIVR